MLCRRLLFTRGLDYFIVMFVAVGFFTLIDTPIAGRLEFLRIDGKVLTADRNTVYRPI